jgi:hypothetical protein
VAKGALAEVQPLIAAGVLDEDYFVDPERFGKLAFRPARAGDAGQLVHFVTLVTWARKKQFGTWRTACPRSPPRFWDEGR